MAERGIAIGLSANWLRCFTGLVRRGTLCRPPPTLETATAERSREKVKDRTKGIVDEVGSKAERSWPRHSASVPVVS